MLEIALTKLYCYLPIRLDTCQDTRANKQLVLDNFELLFKEVLQYGMVREATFDSLGFPDDQNEDGSTARRDATIVQEHCQRAKDLSQEHQKEMRMKAMNAVAKERARATALTKVRILQILGDNKECERILLQEMKMPETSSRNQLTNATVNHFKKPMAKYLKSFCHVRMWDSLNKPAGWRWPNKHRRPGSASQGDLLTELAHSLRDKKVTLKVPVDPTYVAQEQSTSPEAPPPTVECLGANSCDFLEPASSFLSDGGWVSTVRNSVKGAIFIEEIDKDPKRRADVLSKIMLARLRTHVAKKVHSNCRAHYSLNWFQKQIPRLAAMIVMSQQVKDEPDNFDANGCLLKHPVLQWSGKRISFCRWFTFGIRRIVSVLRLCQS